MTDIKKATSESMTPYAAAKVVNATFEANGSDKRIPSQMMYNYTRARINKGKASFITVDENGLITPEGLNEWMVKYFKKNGIDLQAEATKATKVAK